MTQRVLIAILFGFLSGIVCRSFFYVPWHAYIFVTFLICMLLIGYLCTKRFRYVLLVIAVAFMLAGSMRTELMLMDSQKSIGGEIGHSVTVSGKVVEDPDVRESGQRIVVENEDGIRALVTAPPYPEVYRNQRVEAKGVLEEPEPFATDGGRKFRYDRFLAKDGIRNIVSNASISVTGNREGVIDKFIGLLSDCKRIFTRALEDALPEPHASLAAGMLLGGKQGLGSELVDAFTIVGLVHIVVLSGYNIMIVAEAVLRATGFLPKKTAIGISIVVIAAFVLIAGAGSAALRAGFMACIGLFARATGRSYDALRALGITVFIIALTNPLLIAYDPGLQLSILATIGLIVGAPQAERILSRLRPTMLREIVATTCAAQVFVLPLLLYQTGSLSLVTLPANVLVLPVVPLAMALSFIASSITLVAPALAILAGLPAYAALSYIIAIAEGFSRVPFAQVLVPAFPFWVVLASYALLAYGLRLLSRRYATPPP